MAWTDTQHLLANIDFRLRELQWQNSGSKGTRPEPNKPPPLAAKVDAEQERTSEAQRRFMQRFG